MRVSFSTTNPMATGCIDSRMEISMRDSFRGGVLMVEVIILTLKMNKLNKVV